MLCLLGPPVVQVDDEVLPLRLRPKALALLARVALDGPVSRAVLAELIFPDAEDGRAAVRWHLNHLRTQLPKAAARHLDVTSEGVAFRGQTDVKEFRVAAARLTQQPADPGAAEMLGLYRGDLCAGLTVSASAVFDTWLYVQQEALRRAFRQATVAVAQHDLASGAAARIVEPLARLIAVDPYFEEAHRLLIESHERLGRRDAAEAAYTRYQRIVRQELQTEPPLALAQRYEQSARVARTPPQDSLVALRALTLHLLDWAGGPPPVVGFHGSTMSAYALTGLAERLAPEFRFVAADLRGHGFSDKPPTGYDVERHVEDASEFIGVLGLRRPVLLGFSLGGAIAVHVATRVDCAGLVLLDGVVGDRAFTENAAALVMPSQRESLDVRVGGFDEYLAHWRSQFTTHGFSDEAERVLERTMRYELAPLSD